MITNQQQFSSSTGGRGPSGHQHFLTKKCPLKGAKPKKFMCLKLSNFNLVGHATATSRALVLSVICKVAKFMKT